MPEMTRMNMRSRFLDKNGRLPPTRGILKELDPVEQDLQFKKRQKDSYFTHFLTGTIVSVDTT